MINNNCPEVNLQLQQLSNSVHLGLQNLCFYNGKYVLEMCINYCFSISHSSWATQSGLLLGKPSKTGDAGCCHLNPHPFGNEPFPFFLPSIQKKHPYQFKFPCYISFFTLIESDVISVAIFSGNIWGFITSCIPFLARWNINAIILCYI